MDYVPDRVSEMDMARLSSAGTVLDDKFSNLNRKMKEVQFVQKQKERDFILDKEQLNASA